MLIRNFQYDILREAGETLMDTSEERLLDVMPQLSEEERYCAKKAKWTMNDSEFDQLICLNRYVDSVCKGELAPEDAKEVLESVFERSLRQDELKKIGCGEDGLF